MPDKQKVKGRRADCTKSEPGDKTRKSPAYLFGSGHLQHTGSISSFPLHHAHQQVREAQPDALLPAAAPVERGGGRSGPVPFADISTGEINLSPSIRVAEAAAVVAAQLSLHKREKMHRQTASQPNNYNKRRVSAASYGCAGIEAGSGGARRIRCVFQRLMAH